jgi:hypothetical protein
MKRLKSILTVLLIFGSGLVVGAIVGGAATLHDFVNRTFRDGPVNIRKVLVQRAKHDLHLDEDQAHQFWQILTETGLELHKVSEPVRPEIESTLAQAEMRLRAVLKASQQPAFDSFMKAARARWSTALSTESAVVEKAP